MLDLQYQLAEFESDDLGVRVHGTTQELPIDRFQAEVPHLTPLPEHRFLGALALSRKVSWDCLVSFRGNRYSVPAVYAGKRACPRLARGVCGLSGAVSRRVPMLGSSCRTPCGAA